MNSSAEAPSPNANLVSAGSAARWLAAPVSSAPDAAPGRAARPAWALLLSVGGHALVVAALSATQPLSVLSRELSAPVEFELHEPPAPPAAEAPPQAIAPAPAPEPVHAPTPRPVRVARRLAPPPPQPEPAQPAPEPAQPAAAPEPAAPVPSVPALPAAATVSSDGGSLALGALGATTRGGVPGGVPALGPVSHPAPRPANGLGADRSRAPGLAGAARWDCDFPMEADDAGLDSAVVTLRVKVRGDGSVDGVDIASDPGHGFAREARRCALRKRWKPGLDRSGQPVEAAALVNVRFVR